MQALKDKRKFGWGKPPKNRNCKKFGIQRGGPYCYRNALHILLFHTEGWDQHSGKFDELYWTIRDIKNYYEHYKTERICLNIQQDMNMILMHFGKQLMEDIIKHYVIILKNYITH